MERLSAVKWFTRVYAVLLETIAPDLRFPGGTVISQQIDNCLSILEKKYGEVSRERIIDFCICQVYAISRYDKSYLHKWHISHSLGLKALERYHNETQGKRYYEDQWLHQSGLSREKLLELIADRSQHPLAKFIYPEYEEYTKRRLLSSEAGYYNCGASTLLWTPFSISCSHCSKSALCQQRTIKLYPELYRIRIDEYKKKQE